VPRGFGHVVGTDTGTASRFQRLESNDEGYDAPVQQWDLTAIETPGGTVSPVVLDSQEDARAVLIGLEPGQELGDHQVKERAFVLVVSGDVRVEGDGRALDAGPGALFSFQPDERHAISSAGGARILLVLSPWPGPGHYRGGGVNAP
jgi:quercetin dioxygenase-like cupin family protein